MSSIKEALTNLQVWCDEQGSKLGAVDGYDYHSGEEAAYRHVAIEIGKRLKALTTFQPDGEMREAIARVLCKRHGRDPDWPIPIDKYGYHQEPFVNSRPSWDWFHGHDADAILASGLVQNEADIRASDLADRLCTGKAAWPLACHSPNSCSRHERCMYFHCIHQGEDISAAIRSAINEDLK